MRRPTRQSVFRLEVCRSIPKKGISTHVQIPRAVCQARLYSGTAGPEIGTRRPGVGMRRPVWRHASLLNTLEIFTNPKHPPPRESCTPPKVPQTRSDPTKGPKRLAARKCSTPNKEYLHTFRSHERCVKHVSTPGPLVPRSGRGVPESGCAVPYGGTHHF